MELINNLKNNSVLVVPNNIKDKVLMELDNHELINVKIMSLNEIKEHLTYTYSSDAVLYLMNKYQIKYNIAKTYLDNMYYLDGCLTSSDKLNELTLMKNNLFSHNMLKKDNLFKSFLNGKNVVIYGYDYYDNFNIKLIEKLKTITDTTVFYKVESPKKDLKVYEATTITEEVEFVLNSIIALLEKGVKITNIKLANIDGDYKKEIKRIFNFYNIPVNLEEKVSLYDTNISKEFIRLLKEENDFYDISILLKNKYDSTLYNKLINVMNKFVWYKESKTNILELIEHELKHTFIKENRHSNAVDLIDIYNNEIDDATHVFLLGFNNGSMPRVLKDEDFISDKLKQELGLNTSYEINKIVKNATINILNTINNLTISYKKKTPFDEFYPSTLIKDFNMEVLSVPELNYEVSYSKDYNDIKIGRMLDNLLKYGEVDDHLDLLYNNTSHKFLNYDNKFTGINKTDLLKYLNNNLLLSYSALDNFYHCKFKYYLANILKIDIFDSTLAVKVGNIFHYILSKKDEPDFDLDRLYEQEISKLENPSIKDLFYINKLKSELGYILEVLKYHQSLSGFNDSFYEKKFYVDKSRDIKITFMGVIDKILYTTKNNQKLISIIDYKTGNADINLKLLPNGLKMQLPMYIYLVKNSDEFKDARITGIYLQNILNKVNALSDEKLDSYKKELKLSGYSNCDESILEVFDTTYESSSMINGMKKKKDGGFMNYTKLLSDKEIEKIESIVNDKIDSAIDSILEGDFSINPKKLNNDLVGCDYCKFKDICYRKERDNEVIEDYKDLSFLGGEDNA